jgi:hypothetical protein
VRLLVRQVGVRLAVLHLALALRQLGPRRGLGRGLALLGSCLAFAAGRLALALLAMLCGARRPVIVLDTPENADWLQTWRREREKG